MIVALRASAVRESRERVGAALVNAGFAVPPRRMTINLAPADVRKEGNAYDLPMAIGVLVGTGEVDAEAVERCVFLGELGLDGSLRPVRGALPIARRVAGARANGKTRALLLPAAKVSQASLVCGLALSAPGTLAELVEWLRIGALQLAASHAKREAVSEPLGIFGVAGQEGAKRALGIAAAGGHGCLLPWSSRPHSRTI